MESKFRCETCVYYNGKGGCWVRKGKAIYGVYKCNYRRIDEGDNNSKQFRVWWIRNMTDLEYTPVSSIEEAISVLSRLAKEDLNNPDVESNVGGFEYYDEEEGEWLE